MSSPSGAPATFQVSDNGAAQEIRIGNADEYTSGTQVYEVRYTLHNVLNPITADGKPVAKPDTVEFHYNVFGSNELTQRERVNVVVNAPAASTQVACFQGEAGSNTQCQAKAGSPTTFAAMGLAPGEAMTIIAGYPAAAFDNPQPDVRDGNADSTVGWGAAPPPTPLRPRPVIGRPGPRARRHGGPRLDPRAGRAVRRPHARPHAVGHRAGVAAHDRPGPDRTRSPSSSTRPPGCRRDSSARSSTRRRIPSTCPRR